MGKSSLASNNDTYKYNEASLFLWHFMFRIQNMHDVIDWMLNPFCISPDSIWILKSSLTNGKIDNFAEAIRELSIHKQHWNVFVLEIENEEIEIGKKANGEKVASKWETNWCSYWMWQ